MTSQAMPLAAASSSPRAAARPSNFTRPSSCSADGSQSVFEHVDFTRVRFRQLEQDEIARYVEIDRPFDCAGGFRSEGLGATLLHSIETQDPAALIGLPIIWVAQALREAGLDPLAPPQP